MQSSNQKKLEKQASAISDDAKKSGNDYGQEDSNDDGLFDEDDSQGNMKGDSKKITKNEKRLLQNRVSAQRFRQKRKNEFETLKDNMRRLVQENEMLRNQVQELNSMLKHQQEIYAAQEVQMQAIQSSLMEMFCKQVLTQQNGGQGSGVTPGGQQAPHQQLSGDASQNQPQGAPPSMPSLNSQIQLAQNIQGIFNSTAANNSGMQQSIQQQRNLMGDETINQQQLPQNTNQSNDLQSLQMQLLSNLTGQTGANGNIGHQNLNNSMLNNQNPTNNSDMVSGSTIASNAFGGPLGNVTQSLKNGNLQGPQSNDLLKNLQNLLDMQSNQQRGQQNFSDQGAQGYQNPLQSQLMGKSMNNQAAQNNNMGGNNQTNNLAQMLQTFLKQSGNQQSNSMDGPNPIQNTNKDNQVDDEMHGDDKNKTNGMNMQGGQQAGTNLLNPHGNLGAQGSVQNQLLMAALQGIANNNQNTLLPQQQQSQQHQIMPNNNNNFDILSNNGQLQNNIQMQLNASTNQQQQQNQSPGAFLEHQDPLNNNRNNEMSQINQNDQSVCSNLLNQNQTKGVKNSSSNLIHKIQQQLKANVQSSMTGQNNGQLTPLANGSRSPLLGGGQSNIGPSPILKPNQRDFFDRNLNVSQGGLTPRSLNGQRGLNGNFQGSINGAFRNIGDNKAKLAPPIVLVQNGSPKTNNHSQNLTPKSAYQQNGQNGNQMGTALEALLKQLRNGGPNTPVGGGASQYGKKNNELSSPLIGNKQANNQGQANQVLNQFMKSQMSSNNGNTFSNINGLSTPQGFDQVSNNNMGMDVPSQLGLGSPNMRLGGAHQNSKQHQLEINDGPLEEINQLNRKIAGGRIGNNFSFVDLNILPQEQREAIEASARQLKEASEMRQKEQPDPQDIDLQGLDQLHQGNNDFHENEINQQD